MHSNRTLRITLISFMLILGSLLSTFLITPTVCADPIGGETTFYFKDILGLEEPVEYDSNMGISVLVSQNPPTKQNDSEYPPIPPKLLNGFEINEEEWINWFSAWALYLLEDSGLGDDLGEYGDLFGGLYLLLPHPYRIVETYEHNENESVDINGDIVFDLHFLSDATSKRNNDEVNIGLYSMNPESIIPLPKEIKNKTVKITPDSTTSAYKQKITMENVNYTLDPGESLLFLIEIVPSNKTIVSTVLEIFEMPIVENFTESVVEALENQENNSERPLLQEIGTLIKEFRIIAEDEEINITKEQISEIFTAVMSSSFVYDSANHPSSVTLPFEVNGSEDENKKIYYLRDGNQMNEETPTKSDSSSIDLSENSPKWDGSKIDRSKIIKNARANLYLNHQDLNILKGKIKVIATLFDGDTIIASSEKEFDKTTIQDLLETSDSSLVVFSFDNINDREIKYNNSLSLKISVGNDTNSGFLKFLRTINLLYDSENCPSSLTVEFEETEHIKMNVVANPSNEKVVPGDSVSYIVDITSDSEDDTVEITKSDFSDSEKENWSITIAPESFFISVGEKKTINILVTSNSLVADGDKLELTFVAAGKTGKDIFDAVVEVSEEAVEYEINVTVPPGRTIKHGENDTYHFMIANKNTGIWPDDYVIDVSSEHGWNVSYDKNVKDLEPGDEYDVEVMLYVPKNTNITSDNLIFTVTSVNGEIFVTVNITTTIIVPNFLENLYEFFESASENLGLDGVFGSYGPHFLAAILFIIIFFIIIIMILLYTTKFVKIICLERIKEISPEEGANFEITIRNPTKKTHRYELSTQMNSESSKWTTSLDVTKTTLKSNQSKNVTLTVRPTELVKPEDWTEVNFIVDKEGKGRSEKMTAMTMIKGAETKLSFGSVSHWPRTFKEGDKIKSFFVLENKGNISSNVSVILYVNGKEKNKVGDITIPADSYADIIMPWIAVNGKNEINIVVK